MYDEICHESQLIVLFPSTPCHCCFNNDTKTWKKNLTGMTQTPQQASYLTKRPPTRRPTTTTMVSPLPIPSPTRALLLACTDAPDFLEYFQFHSCHTLNFLTIFPTSFHIIHVLEIDRDAGTNLGRYSCAGQSVDAEGRFRLSFRKLHVLYLWRGRKMPWLSLMMSCLPTSLVLLARFQFNTLRKFESLSEVAYDDATPAMRTEAYWMVKLMLVYLQQCVSHATHNCFLRVASVELFMMYPGYDLEEHPCCSSIIPPAMNHSARLHCTPK
jgi:hypothetical protein